MENLSADIGTRERRTSVSSLSSTGYDTSFTMNNINTVNNLNNNSSTTGNNHNMPSLESPNNPMFSSTILPNTTGSSLLSSRVSQSRYFGVSTPVLTSNGLNGLLLNQLPSNTYSTASPIDTTAATEASNTINTISSNNTNNFGIAANTSNNNGKINDKINDNSTNSNDKANDNDNENDNEHDNKNENNITNNDGNNGNDAELSYALNSTIDDIENIKDTISNNNITDDNIKNKDNDAAFISNSASNRNYSKPNSEIIQQVQHPTLTGSTNNSISSNWLSQQHSNSLLNVTPWIEQQAQVSPNLNFHQYSTINGISSHSTGNNDQSLATNLSMLTSSTMMSQQQQLRQPQFMKLSNNNISPPNTSETNMNTNFSSNYSLYGVGLNNYQSLQSPTTNYNNTNSNNATQDTSTFRSNLSNSNNTTNNKNTDDEDLIPTAIVIKNIPFAIKKEQLLDVMSKLNLPLPYAFNYHFDNGVFRGLAFANFNSIEETAMVVSVMNGREIDGRKLRVEYKKMLPVQERERIEREKKEKRCQLEEQHRSASATSLASLYSTASAPPQTSFNSLGNVVDQSSAVNSIQNSNFLDKPIINFPSLADIRPLPSDLDFNNSEVLEIYTRLIIFREECKHNPSTSDLMISSASLSNEAKLHIKQLCSYLSLVETNENGIVTVKKPEVEQCNELTGGENLNSLNLASLSINTNPNTNTNNFNTNSNIMSFQPSLIRSHSHTVLASNPALLLNNNRYRQQSPRAVSQSQQYSYNNQVSNLGMNNFSISAMNNMNMGVSGQGLSNLQSLQQLQQHSQQQAHQLHHSSSTASLNLLRNKGLTAPNTPNPNRQTTFPVNTSLGMVGSQQAPPQQQHFGFNHAQITGGSNISMSTNKGMDEFYSNTEYLNFEQGGQ